MSTCISSNLIYDLSCQSLKHKKIKIGQTFLLWVQNKGSQYMFWIAPEKYGI